MAGKSFAVLIVGYQRVDSIREILLRCALAGVDDVLISVDYPKNQDTASLANYYAIKELVQEFQGKFKILSSKFFLRNVGCSINVLSACDWAFEKYESVVVLEDDCLPSSDFFDYCEEANTLLKSEPSILLACGTQFCPSDVTNVLPFISKYALTWGWFTQAEKWRIIREHFFKQGWKVDHGLLEFKADLIYWSEGARRAYRGFVDVWDTPLVSFLQHSSYFALLPAENLVTNTGNDVIATHTGQDRTWTQLAPGRFASKSLGAVGRNVAADLWLRNNFYRISWRHILTTRITRLKDTFKSPVLDELLARWKLNIHSDSSSLS